ncbi:MAG: T9SS type A sorting domain-containing protein [Muribaculaceae bacterium]|nr:T9SS type A sorting domain-containing protein [Muribaculaceae bacterium]
MNPNNDTVSIYNINGVMIEQSTETGFNAAVTPGIYVVKSSTAAIKVAVK